MWFHVSCLLLICTMSNYLDACTLPADLQGSDWTYQPSSETATFTFGTSSMSGFSLLAEGETITDYTCISNTNNVYVFKSDLSYSSEGTTTYLYLCMKLTRVSDDLYYFYLLADVNPVTNERVHSVADGSVNNGDPTCSFCTFSTAPPDSDVRQLRRSGTSETLPGGETLCLPCDNPTCDTTEEENACADGQEQCKRSGYCYPAEYRCDGYAYCWDGTDECGCEDFTCPDNKLKCPDDVCGDVNGVLCNGQEECPRGSDEQECESCNGADLFHCPTDKKCIPESWRCDGYNDCSGEPGSSDEQNCDSCNGNDMFLCPAEKTCIPASWRCDGDNDCSGQPGSSDEENCRAFCTDDGKGFCSAENKCIPSSWVCDVYKDCSDGEDEMNCAECNSGFLCSHDNKCIFDSFVCDSDPDCSDGEDDLGCGFCSSDEFLCWNYNCIPSDQVCDGNDNCGDNSDEDGPGCGSGKKKRILASGNQDLKGERILRVRKQYLGEKKRDQYTKLLTETSKMLTKKQILHSSKINDRRYENRVDVNRRMYGNFKSKSFGQNLHNRRHTATNYQVNKKRMSVPDQTKRGGRYHATPNAALQKKRQKSRLEKMLNSVVAG